ncbi:MAG: endonuclease NucS domain-containing protein, partial [Pseudanabaena sp. ELA607]
LEQSIAQTNAALALSSQEFDRRMAQSRAEAEQRAAEAAKRMAEFDQQMKELGKQIGGLGEKFGSFTEGLALPSMTKILGQRFGMEVISPSIRVRKGKDNVEVDVLAYSNGEVNAAYVVEVKSHAKQESIEQLKKILNKFRYFFPEHSSKTVYGILAAVDITEDLKEKVLQEGLYVARISDDTFAMDTPDDFEPKTW